MRRFICMLLVFSLCIFLFVVPANAASPSGAFSYIKLINADKYTRSISGDYRVTGVNVSYSNLFYSVFPKGMNYTAQAPADGTVSTYYLPKDNMGSLLVADLSNSSILETLLVQLDGIASSLSSLKSYSSSIASYTNGIYNKIISMDTDIGQILSYVTKLNTACTSINDHLTAIQAYENVSATQLLNIVDILTADMPTIITDLETALDFLYSIDNDVYHIRNHLATIHQDLTQTNEYLESIEEHLNAEALKGYDTSTGMNFFELAGNVLGNGFNVVGSFFSYAFMSISALLAPGLEGFDQIANIWSWNNSGYKPDYIVPETGGG